jgi:hypothetical protein
MESRCVLLSPPAPGSPKQGGGYWARLGLGSGLRFGLVPSFYGSPYVAQAGLELLVSSDPPASASQVAGAGIDWKNLLNNPNF